LIDVRDGAIILERKTEYSGEFDLFLAGTLPTETQTVDDYALHSGTKWYTVAAAVVITVGAIYWIYRAFERSVSGDGTIDGPPVTQ
jgi:hypothetical protein